MPRTPVRAAVLVAALMAVSPFAAAAATAEPASSVPTVVADDSPVTWSVEASPTKQGGRRAFTYDVDPGTQIQDSFLITNAGDTAAEFVIYATDAFNDPDTGNFSLLAHDAPPTDLGAWITPADDKLTIGAHLQARVPFNLLIPSDASPGDHSAGIVAAVLTETEQDGSTVLLEQRVGVRMYLTVSGEAVSSVEVQGMTSSFAPSLNPFAPGDLTVQYDVRNTGNKRVDVTQALHAAGVFGIPVAGSEPEPIRDLLPRQAVHVNVTLSGVGALLYTDSTVEVTPGAVGSAPAAPGAPEDATPTPRPTTASETAAPTPDATPGAEAAAYEPVSEHSWTIAITWTLLGLVLLIAAIVYLVYRYVTGTRERMYAAIDEATEAARAEAAEAARVEAARAEAVPAAAAARRPASTKATSRTAAPARASGPTTTGTATGTAKAATARPTATTATAQPVPAKKKAPAKNTPEKKAPEKTAPEKKASEKTAPEKNVSEKKAPEKKTPEKKAPQQKAPGKKTPEKTGPEKTSPETKTSPSKPANAKPTGAAAKPRTRRTTPETEDRA